MSEDNAKHDEIEGAGSEMPFFTAVLTPHRSLGPNGFLVLMVCLGAVSFVAGILFLMIGAWPVFGFFGLDVLLIYLAFRLNYKAARAYEEISISRTEVIIRKVGPGKKREEYVFNPFWVRLSVTKLSDEGVTNIALLNRDQKIDLGNFLNPQDRTSFAAAITRALSASKAGYVPTSS